MWEKNKCGFLLYIQKNYLHPNFKKILHPNKFLTDQRFEGKKLKHKRRKRQHEGIFNNFRVVKDFLCMIQTPPDIKEKKWVQLDYITIKN